MLSECGKSGPAQIRTAVTATRRPKDTKLPHRPASGFSAFVRLTLPNGQRPQRPAARDPGLRLEIPVPVATTPWVEFGPTRRTRVVVGPRPTARGTSLAVASEVRPGGQRRPADAAEDRRVVEPGARPGVRIVVGRLDVTGVTRRKHPTAAEPEGHDVELRRPVGTPGLRVDRDAAERDSKAVVGGRGVGGTALRVGPAAGWIPVAHRRYSV